MLKNRMKRSPVKKVGRENHTKARVVATWSKSEYGRTRGVRPDGQRDQDGQELGAAEHEEGGGQALQDEGVHVHPAHEREPPVAPEHGGEPAQVADEHGVVETVLGPEVGAHLGRHVGIGGQLLEGVARGQGQDGEEDQTDPEQDRDRP